MDRPAIGGLGLVALSHNWARNGKWLLEFGDRAQATSSALLHHFISSTCLFFSPADESVPGQGLIVAFP